MKKLVDVDKLLERIILQNGIYGMTVDEVIGFIKEERKMVKDNEEELQRKNDEYASEIDEYASENGEYECKIDNIRSLVKNASNNFNRKNFIECLNEAIDY